MKTLAKKSLVILLVMAMTITLQPIFVPPVRAYSSAGVIDVSDHTTLSGTNWRCAGASYTFTITGEPGTAGTFDGMTIVTLTGNNSVGSSRVRISPTNGPVTVHLDNLTMTGVVNTDDPLIEITSGNYPVYMCVDNTADLINSNGQAIYVTSTSATLYILGEFNQGRGGSLYAKSANGAGIGGGILGCGTIIINSDPRRTSDGAYYFRHFANITAIGGPGCAGIGGGSNNGAGGSISIFPSSSASYSLYSKHTFRGGLGGAGIGGGNGGAGGTINIDGIEGSEITAEGGYGAAGIGGGLGGAGGNINIKGGVVINASGAGTNSGGGSGPGGAGIGGGAGGAGGFINIDNAWEINSTGTGGGAGIGGGSGAASGDISITGKTDLSAVGGVSTSANWGGAGIGSGGAGAAASNPVGRILIESSGSITAEGAGQAAYKGAAIGTGGTNAGPGTPVLPVAPSNFDVQAGYETATLSWSTLLDTGLYENHTKDTGERDSDYEVSSNGGLTWTKVPLGELSYTYPNLIQYSTYTFMVRGLFSRGYGVSAQKTVTLDATAPTITGPAVLTLPYGYAAASTSAYTITGSAPVTVTKESGNSRITWNDTNKRLDIAEGLTSGEYEVVLKADNGIPPAASLTFTLTVENEPATVTGVTVMPNTAVVRKGGTQIFAASVQGANNPAQSVTWTVEGATSPGTSISDGGLLTVNSDETGITLTVRATSTVNTAFSGTATVTPADKKQALVSGVSVSSGLYRGTPYAFIGTPVFTDSDGLDVTGAFTPIIEYTGTTAAGSLYGPTGQAPANAGIYFLSFAVPAGHPDYYGTSLLSFEITKKTVTVEAKSNTVKWRDNLPSLEYNVSGFIPPDNATDGFETLPVPKYNVNNTMTAGNSYIEFEPQAVLKTAYAANYTLRHLNGVLTIVSDELPEFQLHAATPKSIYNGTDKRVLSLTGANLHRTAIITFSSGSVSHNIDIADISDIYTLNAAKTVMSLDLARLPYFNGFMNTENYMVKLTSDTGWAAMPRNFEITADKKFAPAVSGYLRIFQKSDRTFGAEMVSSEFAGSGNTVLITIRGDISEIGGGEYIVKEGCTINKALNYYGEELTVKVSPSAASVVSRNGIPSNVLKWQGISLTTGGFNINLSNNNTYKRTRVGSYGTDIRINFPGATGAVNLYALKTEAGYGLRLYESEFSIDGSLSMEANLPGFMKAEAKVELLNMIMRNQLGLPPLHVKSEFSLKTGALMSGFIEGASLDFELNTLPENLYSYMGMKGELDIAEVILLQGEFIFTWNMERMLFIPEKIDFFARLGQGGVPLVPPIILAYISGFGGGINGLAKTIYGDYDKIPPISINAKGAIRDSTDLIIDVGKATITLGPREFSAIANEAVLYKFINLEDVGLRFGFLAPKPASSYLPDMYLQFTGGMQIGYKSIAWLKGSLDLKAVMHGKYIENTASNAYKFFKHIIDGNTPASYPNYQNVANDLLMLVDASGRFWGEIGVDIKVFKGVAKGELGVSKEGLDVTLSGSIDAEAKAMFGLIPLGSASIGLSYNITRNDFSYWTRTMASSGDSASASATAPAAGDYTESLSFSNIHPVAALSMGKRPAPTGGMSLFSVNPSTVTLTDDKPHGVEMTSDESNSVIKVTAPTTVGDVFAAYPAGDLLNTDGEVYASVAITNGKKVVTFNDGTIFTEGEASNIYYIKPVWTLNDESGLYDGGFMILGAGLWDFDSDSNVDLTILVIAPMPVLTSAACSGTSVSWTYDGNGADISAAYTKLLLCDAETDEIVEDLTPYTAAGIPLSGLSLRSADVSGIMSGVSSGQYYVLAQLYNEKQGSPDECLSIISSDVFNYTNPNAPAQVTGVKTAYAGNGMFNVSWNAVTGADGYIVEILDENSNKLEGIAAIDVKGETEVIISGEKVLSTTIDPDTGAEEETLTGLDFGGTYNISVRAYKENTMDSGNLDLGKSTTTLYGLAGTVRYTLPVPVTPKLTVDIPGARVIDEDGMRIYAVNTLSPTINVSTDTGASVTIKMFDGGVWNGSFSGDGRYALKVRASAPTGDYAEIVLNLLVNTGYPGILIDEASLYGTNGQIAVNGAVELGSAISADGTQLTTDMGSFTHARKTNRLVTPVSFMATNASGNSTERLVEVLMTDAGTLTGIELRLSGGSNNGENKISIGQSTGLELWGIFDSGAEYVLDEANASLLPAVGNSVNLDVNAWTVTGLRSGASTITVTYELDENTSMKADITVTVEDTTPGNKPTVNGGNSGGKGILPGAEAMTIQELETPTAPGFPFTDVREGDWFYDDVFYCWQKELFNGTSATTFSPNATLSRDMVVTVLYRMAGSPDVSAAANPFTDVPDGSWYSDAVKWGASNEIVLGYGEGIFLPGQAVTRQELATLLMRYASLSDVVLNETRGNPSFADATDIAEFAKEAVDRCYRTGIINGKPGNLADPQGSATRAEFAAMLHRML